MTTLEHWVPPFFTCGACGGEIGRYPMTNLLRQRILDWRHRTVPEGAVEHRAVLGTPVPIYDQHVEEPEEEGEVSIPEPQVPARQAYSDEIPRSAENVRKAAESNGWLAEAWYMLGPHMDARWRMNRTEESVVLRFLRDGHGLVAVWSREAQEGDWAFEEGWSLTHHVEAVTSPQLRKIIDFPRMVCETCDETLTRHHVVPEGFLCHAEFLARQSKEAA